MKSRKNKKNKYKKKTKINIKKAGNYNEINKEINEINYLLTSHGLSLNNYQLTNNNINNYLNKLTKAEGNTKKEFNNSKNQALLLSLKKNYIPPHIFNWIIYLRKIKRTNDDIKIAVNHWCSDDTAAQKKYGHISEWDTSEVNDMSNLFRNKQNFNHNITGWDVSSVTNMENMFCKAESFDQDIGGWDVSNVKNMSEMFFMAKSFNQYIGEWNVSKVNKMNSMFQYAINFNNGEPSGESNKPLNWNVSSVDFISSMFVGAENFNQDINEWKLNSIPNKNFMYGMFYNCPLLKNPPRWYS